MYWLGARALIVQCYRSTPSRETASWGDATLPEAAERRFRGHVHVRLFAGAAAVVRKKVIWWVLSGKLQATGDKRLDLLIASGSDKRRI